MKDDKIIALFFQRDEQAISEVQKHYGAGCYGIAKKFLDLPEDCEECVNETWVRAWSAIPPLRPKNLKVYLFSITRNLAFNRLRYRKAERRQGNETAAVLEELDNCIASVESPEDTVIAKELKQVLNEFLDLLPMRDRDIFLRRYFFADSIKEISQRYSLREGNVAVILNRVRKKLKQHLIKEGYIYDK